MSKNLMPQMQDTMGGHHFIFENSSSCVPESDHTVAAKQQSISTNIHLPEHARLRQPSNAWFQSTLDEFYPVQARASCIAYSQKCLSEGSQFGNATRVKQRRRVALWICVTHLYKFLQENCRPSHAILSCFPSQKNGKERKNQWELRISWQTQAYGEIQWPLFFLLNKSLCTLSQVGVQTLG